MRLIHDAPEPELRSARARDAEIRALMPRDHDTWEDGIYKRLIDLKHWEVNEDNVADYIECYVSWLKIEIYNYVRQVLLANRDPMQARQALLFLISEEKP